MRATDVIRALTRAGYEEVKGRGSHRNFKHPDRPGKVTVPFHTGDLKIGTIRSIERDTGLTLLPRP